MKNFFISCDRILKLENRSDSWENDFNEYTNLTALVLVFLLNILVIFYYKMFEIDIKTKKIIKLYLTISSMMISRFILRILMREYWFDFVGWVCPKWFPGQKCLFCDVAMVIVMLLATIINWFIMFMFWLTMNNISEILNFNHIMPLYKAYSFTILFLTILGNGAELIMKFLFFDDVDGRGVYLNKPEAGGKFCGIGPPRFPNYLTCADDWVVPYNLTIMIIIVLSRIFMLYKSHLLNNVEIIKQTLRYTFILFIIILINIVSLLSIYYINVPTIWPLEYLVTMLSLFMLLPIGTTFYRFFCFIPLKLSDIIISKYTRSIVLPQSSQVNENIELGNIQEDEEITVSVNNKEITEFHD